MPLEQANPNEVPAEAAYAAAEERAVKTTRALILAEAQVLTLGHRVQQLERDCLKYADQLRQYEDAPALAEETCPNQGRICPDDRLCKVCPKKREEVTHDAADDEVDRAAPGCEACGAYDFSD